MEQRDFMTRAKQLVVDYFNSHVDATDGKKLTMEDVPSVTVSQEASAGSSSEESAP